MQSQMGGPIPNQLGGPVQNQMGGNIQGQMGASMQNQMGPMQSQMGGPMGPGAQMGSPMSAQMSHMVQKNAQARTMNAQFIRQTPTPPQQSPVGLQHTNQMVASPALVPSPSPAAPMSSMQRSVGMAPSPSGSLNTPGQAQPLSSPCNVAEDQVGNFLNHYQSVMVLGQLYLRSWMIFSILWTTKCHYRTRRLFKGI